jgi:competence protein ComEC
MPVRFFHQVKNLTNYLKFCSQPVARPLIPVTLAFMAGVGAPALGLPLPLSFLTLGPVVLWLALALLYLARRSSGLLPLAFFWLLGLAFCLQAGHPVVPLTDVANLPRETELSLLGQMDRPPKAGGARLQLFLKVEAWRSPEGWRPASGKLLVTAPQFHAPPLGTALIVRGDLRLPQSLQNPGAPDRPRHLAADRIFREVNLKETGDLVVLVSSGPPPLRERLRGGIRKLLDEMEPVLRAFNLAMLLGDQGEITPDIRRNLARTGTSHLLVINGMHLGMVAAVVFFLSFWLLRRSPWLMLRVNVVKIATLLAAGPVVAYAWLAGGSPSTQRAEIMVLAYLFLVLLGRPREVWSALALAALAVLVLNPLRLYYVSFQLSFISVAALIYFIPRWFASRETGAAAPSHHKGRL